MRSPRRCRGRSGRRWACRGWRAGSSAAAGRPTRLRRTAVAGFAALGLAYGLGFWLLGPRLDRRGVEWAFYESAARLLPPARPWRSSTTTGTATLTRAPSARSRTTWPCASSTWGGRRRWCGGRWRVTVDRVGPKTGPALLATAPPATRHPLHHRPRPRPAGARAAGPRRGPGARAGGALRPDVHDVPDHARAGRDRLFWKVALANAILIGDGPRPMKTLSRCRPSERR